jgi:hypothetical protein
MLKMARTRKYTRRPKRSRSLWRNRYLRLVGLLVIIITMSSFYIYQRVWVRNLVAEVDQLKQRNAEARNDLAALKTEWGKASSLGSLEEAIEAFKLDLRPTEPTQNLALRRPSDLGGGRYSGVLNAVKKLVQNIPLVTSSQADAGQLFEDK